MYLLFQRAHHPSGIFLTRKGPTKRSISIEPYYVLFFFSFNQVSAVATKVRRTQNMFLKDSRPTNVTDTIEARATRTAAVVDV